MAKAAKYVGVLGASKLLGVTARRVRQLAAEGRIPGAELVVVGDRGYWRIRVQPGGRIVVQDWPRPAGRPARAC